MRIARYKRFWAVYEPWRRPVVRLRVQTGRRGGCKAS